MKNCIFLLDPGHGGMINKKYQTKGKRSPIFKDRQIFEGVLNREIVKLISERLRKLEIPFKVLVPEQKDIVLQERVHRANSLKTPHNKVYVSIHSNLGGGTGFEVYTSRGLTKADRLASIVWSEIQKEFPDMKMRSCLVDGDVDKESGFYVLRKTEMPAILGENFFMDTLKPDFEILWSKEGKNKIADAYVSAFIRYNSED